MLEAISHGTSYLDVHADVFEKLGVKTHGAPGSEQFETRRSRELAWVELARNAVADAYDQLLKLTNEPGDVAYASLAILVRLPIRQEATRSLIQQFLDEEQRELYRAGLLLLIGQLGLVDDETWTTLAASASSKDELERLAVGLTACCLQSTEFQGPIRHAIVEAMCKPDVAWSFQGLPWNVLDNIRSYLLWQRPTAEKENAADTLFQHIERGASVAGSLECLLELLFPRLDDVPEFTSKDQLSPRHLQLVQTLLDQFDQHRLRLPISLVQYGLPDSWRELRSFITGIPYVALDDTYPDIGYADNPHKPRRTMTVQVGDRLHSRYFGLGTVTEVEHRRRHSSLRIDFDEEGQHTLSFGHSTVSYLFDSACYWLIKCFPDRQADKD